MFHGVDYPRIEVTRATAFTFTESNKALAIQTMGASTTGKLENSDTVYSDAFAGSWCLVAPPAAPTTDSAGNISAACECAVAGMGDDNVVIGERDVRFSKYAQDAKGGEAVLFNAFGSRFALLEKEVALIAGGGFLSFNIGKKKVGIVGIPATPGASAPSITLTSTGIGLVSASGAVSVNIDGTTLTISAGGVAVNGGTVQLGTGASDPVVTLSHLVALVEALVAFFNAHTHPVAGAVAGVTVPPMTLGPTGSTRLLGVP